MLCSCDLYFSAYLLCGGAKMIKTERDKKTSRVYFTFETERDPATLKVEYFNGSGTVNALAYTNQIKSLKSLCHAII
jgi:hypothetical protein